MIFDTLEDAIEYAKTRKAISAGSSAGDRHYCVYLDTLEEMRVAAHVDMPRIKRAGRILWSTRTAAGATGKAGRPPVLDKKQREELRSLRAEGYSYAKLGVLFGVTDMTAWRVCNVDH